MSMSIPRPRDPFQVLIAFARERRATYAQELATGKWANESAGRELVGRVKALDEIESEIAKLTRSDAQFGEKDL